MGHESSRPAGGAASGWAARAFLPVLAVAVAVRLAYWVAFCRSPFFGVYVVDQVYYRTWALRIAAGDWAGQGAFEQGPLYAYLLGGAYRIFGATDPPVLLLQLLAGLGTVALAWRCARSIGGDGSAAAAGLLAAAYGPLVFYECMVMKTFLEPLLVMAALAAGLAGAEKGRARWFALSGAAVGLACLVREVHALLLLPLVAAAWRACGVDRRNVSRLASVAAVAAAFLLMLVPSTLRNWAVSRELVASTSGGGEALYVAFGPQNETGAYTPPDFVRPEPFLEHQDFREEAFFRTRTVMSRREFSHYWYREGLDAALRDPRRTLGLVSRRALAIFSDAEIPDSEEYEVAGDFVPMLRYLPSFAWIAGPGLLGLVLAARRGGRRVLLPVGFAAVLAAELVLTYNFGRFRAPFSAVWILFAGVGVAWAFSPERRRDARSIAILGAAVAALLALDALSLLPPPGCGPWLAEQRAACRRIVPGLMERRREAAILENPPPGYGRSTGRLNALGKALEETGKYVEAIDAYEGALRLDPADVDAHRNLAVIHSTMGEFGRAAVHARAVLAASPGQGQSHYLLGVIVARMGATATDAATSGRLLAQAEGLFRSAATLAPDAAPPHYQLGRVMYLQGRGREAVAEISKALEIDPAFAAAGRDLRYMRNHHGGEG